MSLRLFLSLMTPVVLEANSCAPSPSPKTAWQQAGAVLEGVVDRVTPARDRPGHFLTVGVVPPFKGVSAGQALTVESPWSIHFGRGGFRRADRYLFYLHRGEGEAVASVALQPVCTHREGRG